MPYHTSGKGKEHIQRTEPFMVFVEFDPTTTRIVLSTYEKELVEEIISRQRQGWRTEWQTLPPDSN